MKSIANYISVSRIVLSIILVFVNSLGIAFYAIYIICGFSDIIDGFIARKTKTTSRFGAKLDSIADMVVAFVLLFIFYPIINPAIEIVIWIISIAAIRLISMVVALKKYKTFASIHTYGNKITGIFLMDNNYEEIYLKLAKDFLYVKVAEKNNKKDRKKLFKLRQKYEWYGDRLAIKRKNEVTKSFMDKIPKFKYYPDTINTNILTVGGSEICGCCVKLLMCRL